MTASARQRLDALRLARRARSGSLEAPPGDDVALGEVISDLRAAAECSEERGRAEQYIALAEAELMRGSTLEAVRAAEQAAREAIDRLDCSTDPELALQAWEWLGEALTSTVLVADAQQRQRIEAARGLLFAGESLALSCGGALQLARLRDSLSRVLGERYRIDRDENLMDAVVCGEQALAALRAAHDADSSALPSLLNHLGNCCVKVSTAHRDWLRRGLGHYRDGLATVSAARFPRLHQILERSVAMVEGLLDQDASHDHLPEQEMVSRFCSAVQDALDGADDEGAWRWAMGFLRWAWTLEPAPNVHVGTAHQLLGKLAVGQQAWDQAEVHLYEALLVLSGMLSAEHRWHHLVEETRSLFADALKRAGREPLAEAAIDQAGWALSGARQALADAAQQTTEPAVAALDRAIALYPAFAPALEARARCRLDAGNLAEAIRDAETCLSLQPENVLALSVRAAALTRAEQSDAALMAWKAVLESDPANEAALAQSASLLAAAQHWEEARQHADRLIEINPSLPAAYLLRAGCREKLGDAAGAIADLEQARPAIGDAAALRELEQRISGLRDG